MQSFLRGPITTFAAEILVLQEVVQALNIPLYWKLIGQKWMNLGGREQTEHWSQIYNLMKLLENNKGTIVDWIFFKTSSTAVRLE